MQTKMVENRYFGPSVLIYLIFYAIPRTKTHQNPFMFIDNRPVAPLFVIYIKFIAYHVLTIKVQSDTIALGLIIKHHIECEMNGN